MTIPQKKFRELVVQLLFGLELGGIEEKEIFPLLMKELKITKKEAVSAIAEVKRIWEKREEIDAAIAATSHSYRLERIQKMELSILREAVFSLLFEKKVDPKITISEAIRLCRKFSTSESAAFINALLDTLYKREFDATSNTKYHK